MWPKTRQHHRSAKAGNVVKDLHREQGYPRPWQFHKHARETMNENIVITDIARTPMGEQIDQDENLVLLRIE